MTARFYFGLFRLSINLNLSQNGVWGEAPSKVAGAAAPDNKPGTDAGRVCQKALHDAEPTKHTQPFNEGKGLGDGDMEFTLLVNI